MQAETNLTETVSLALNRIESFVSRIWRIGEEVNSWSQIVNTRERMSCCRFGVEIELPSRSPDD